MTTPQTRAGDDVMKDDADVVQHVAPVATSWSCWQCRYVGHAACVMRITKEDCCCAE